jgi:hypothetical protein
MHILNCRQYFLDSLVEQLGIKSGLAVTVPKALQLLDGSDYPTSWLRGAPEEFVRIDVTEYEFAFIQLLFSVGAIERPCHAVQLIVEFCRHNDVPLPREWNETPMGDDEVDDERDIFSTPTGRLMRTIHFVQSAIIDHLHETTPFPDDLASLPEFDNLFRNFAIRNVTDDKMPDSRKWNGLVPLNDLFESENAPSDPSTFFDQRFIDYLNSQSTELQRIHWRQFEFLTGEYFRRIGYEVKIGPGRNDGGKDVIAIRTKSPVGPEMILVQCKRYDEKYPVDIDEVKAFYQTVRDELATRGLFATTSRLASGARTYCDARKYELNAAEAENVRQWLQEMKSSESVKDSASDG